MSRWSKLTYLPFHPAPWIISVLAILALNALDATPFRWITIGQDLTSSGILAVAGSLGIVNAISLWRQISVRYLTTATALVPFAITLLLLSTVGTTSAYASRKIVVGLGWIRDQPAKPGDSPAPEPSLDRALASGQIFLIAILTSTLFWPPSETLEAVQNARKVLISRLVSTTIEKASLDEALDAFLALKIFSWRNEDDDGVFRMWRAAAATLKKSIAGLATIDLRTQAAGDMQQALNVLQTTRAN